MNNLRLILGCSIMLFSFSCASTIPQQLSVEELAEHFGVITRRLPMPKDDRLIWSIKVVPYAERQICESKSASWMDETQKALIILRPSEDFRQKYLYTISDYNGIGSGDIRLSFCAEDDDFTTDCGGGEKITWHKYPIRVDDGKTYILADLGLMIGNRPTKQLIAKLVFHRLEDIMKQNDE